MHDPQRPTPRLVCRLVRHWETRFGAATELTRLTTRHSENCPDCAEFFCADDAFEQSLRQAAPRMRIEPDGALDARILRAVRESRPAARKTNALAFGLSLAAATASTALAVFIFHRHAPVPTAPQPIAQTAPVSLQSLANTQQAVTQLWVSSVALSDSALALARKDPLQQELDSVYADAHSALHFLALNFLPSAPPSSTPPPASNTPRAGRG